MLLTLAGAALLGGLSLGGKIISEANKYGTNAQQHAYDLEKAQKQYEYDQALKAQQFGYDTELANQKFGYDTELANQKFGYDSALSAQGAQQELAKQINQQQFDKMMSDTEMQRKIADYKAAGVNPALAMGGISNTNAQSGAAQATAAAPTSAKEAKHNAKQEMNAQNMLAITNAVKAGVLAIATKKLNSKAKALAYDPKNKKLEKNLKREMLSYYNLIRV